LRNVGSTTSQGDKRARGAKLSRSATERWQKLVNWETSKGCVKIKGTKLKCKKCLRLVKPTNSSGKERCRQDPLTQQISRCDEKKRGISFTSQPTDSMKRGKKKGFGTTDSRTLTLDALGNRLVYKRGRIRSDQTSQRDRPSHINRLAAKKKKAHSASYF